MWTTYFLSAGKVGVTSLVETSTSTSLSLTSESCACRADAGCHFSRDLDAGTITISQQTVAETMVAKFGVTRNKETLW